MNWIIEFDIAALCICAILIFVYYSFHNFPSFSSRIYRILLWMGLFSVIGDLATIYMSYYLPYSLRALNYIANILYLAAFAIIPALYYLYLIALTDTGVISFRQLSWKALIPYGISLLALLTTPWTHLIFYIDPEQGYMHGSGFALLYIISLFYLVISLRQTLKHHDQLTKLQRTSIWFYTLSGALVVVAQFFFPDYLLLEFVVSLSLFFILLALQNPYEFKDSLTNAFNREAFVRILSDNISSRRKFSVLCLSIDGFRFINEKFGIKNSDNLLVQVCDYLLTLTQRNQLYHITGTQFALLLDESQKPAPLIAQITERFKKPFHLNDVDVELWIYLCSLTYPDNVKNLGDVMDTIDYSIKEAKKSHTDCVIYGSEEILAKKRRETKIQKAITTAIQQESFEVYYQPIYSVKTKQFSSAEALVRLRDAELGFIPPDEFIPMAEKSGQIIQIGEIVMKKVCDFLAANNLSLDTVHVNLSVVQCMQEDLYDTLCQIMDQRKIAHTKINFEITETTAANSSEKLLLIMNLFEENGTHFSLDDYGTGYSNTANLMKHPYSIVKLDKSIVWAAAENPQAMISLKHTVAMLQELNMAILAEGVETREQIEFLTDMQCNYFQGYYYSRPLPEQEFLQFLARAQSNA